MVDYVTNSGPVSTSDTTVNIAGGVGIGTFAPFQTAFGWTPMGTGVMNLYGSIYSSEVALRISGGQGMVNIEAGGAISARNIAINGTLRVLSNFGTIQGNVASTGDFLSMRNYGAIASPSSELIRYAGSGTAAIFNAGSIVGHQRVIVMQTTQTASIVNVGTIASNDLTSTFSLISTTGRLSIQNFGLIVAGNSLAIEAGAEADFVLNRGTIIGGMRLNDGDDIYDTTLGTVSRTVDLGGGADIGTGGAGVDRINGADGIDTLVGNGGDDILNGGADDDTIDGGSGDDVLDGDDGADRLTGGTGLDRMSGGGGDDLYFVDDARDRVIEAADGGNDTVLTSTSYRLAAGQSVEVLRVDPDGDDFGIVLTGNGLAQTLEGGSGDNRLTGGGGADVLIGGRGDDRYVVSDVGSEVRENLDEGYDRLLTSVSFTLPQNVEELRATDPQATAPLTLTGNALANMIFGGAGDDAIDGGSGADRMAGGLGDDTYRIDDARDVVIDSGGRDTVYSAVDFTTAMAIETLILDGDGDVNATGNALANTIAGNSGANVISGRGGADTLTGGLGSDTFVFATSATGAVATIADFETGADRIALDDHVFRAIGRGGALDPHFFSDGAATTRDHHILFDAATGVLSYDADGSGTAFAAVAFAMVQPGVALTAADILVV